MKFFSLFMLLTLSLNSLMGTTAAATPKTFCETSTENDTDDNVEPASYFIPENFKIDIFLHFTHLTIYHSEICNIKDTPYVDLIRPPIA